MIEVSNVPLPLDAGVSQETGQGFNSRAVELLAARLGIEPGQIRTLRLKKRSVDARKKRDVHFIAAFEVELESPELEQRVLDLAAGLQGIKIAPAQPYAPLRIPLVAQRAVGRGGGPFQTVVVGTGPAGLFCAWALARAGLRPLVLERGQQVHERLKTVEEFEQGGSLDPNSNIQFGEGGAGTFSDGKLTTGIKNPLCAHVLHAFVDFGAPAEILYQAKPHIGTDNLVDIVANMRCEIERLGGTVRFGMRFDGVELEAGSVRWAHATNVATGQAERMSVDALVIACGHSARDTFGVLRDAGLTMSRKPFSVGVRIEHPQQMINRIQYGDFYAHPALGSADYKLSCHLGDGRGVYTFCMCPGGEVVCAASEPEQVCVNGMSRYARDGRNANSALLVAVNPEDIPGQDPLAGVEFQRAIEHAAFVAGGCSYKAPAQTVGEFLAAAGAAGQKQAPRFAIDPTYARGVVPADLHQIFPDFVNNGLAEGLCALDRKMPGFAAPDALMTAPETRSSSPVRIQRDPETLQAFVEDLGCGDGDFSKSASGLYPCGEGAGYAGGIMSAAVDGLRVAQRIIARWGE